MAAARDNAGKGQVIMDMTILGTHRDRSCIYTILKL